jgi:hypothetical protein
LAVRCVGCAGCGDGRETRPQYGVSVRVALAAVLLCAGCGSYRSVRLDDAERQELTSLRTRLADASVRRVHPPGEDPPSPEIERALHVLGVDEAPAGESAVELEVIGVGACWNGLTASALTLGALPFVTPGSPFRCRIRSASGAEGEERFVLGDRVVFGWLGLPLAVVPGWSAFIAGVSDPERDDDETRAARLALLLGRLLVERR